MNKQSLANKKAWEYRAYEFWNNERTPEEEAKMLIEDPLKQLKIHKKYFMDVEGKKIANLCGSCGKRAIALSLLGAEATVFDISEENKRYAMETANCANTSLNYVVGDVYDIDINKYANYFDMLYMEGGILHYFDDMNKLARLWHSILKDGGKMVLSDFHPLRRLAGKGNYTAGSSYKECDEKERGSLEEFNYFDSSMVTGDVAYKNFLPEDESEDFPTVLVKMHKLSDIINAVIDAGFTIKHFEEHPDWVNKSIPGEFTLIAIK